MADFDPDTFADKLLARLGKARGNASTDDDDEHDEAPPSKVPYQRFAAKAREVKELRARLAEFEADVGQYKDSTAKAIKAAQEQAKDAAKRAAEEAAGQVARIAQQSSEDLSLVDLGIRDPLGRRAARDAYSLLPEQGRPESVVKWLEATRVALAARESYMADKKADPAKAPAEPEIPATLRAYFQSVAAPAAKPGAAAPRVDAKVHGEGRTDWTQAKPTEFKDWNDYMAKLRESTGDQ